MEDKAITKFAPGRQKRGPNLKKQDLVRGGAGVTSKRLYIKTFGCQMNVRDSEIIYGLMMERGWVRAGSAEEADCVLFNTCSVRAHAEERAYSNMGMLGKLKKKKPGLVLGFVGCTAQKDKRDIFRRLPHVDLVTGPGELYHIPDYVEEILRERRRTIATGPGGRPGRMNPAYHESGHHAYVSISEGCENFCSYCIVPYLRGKQRSRSKKHILEEIREAARQGISEVTLLGQNVNSYGYDLKGKDDFVSLLRGIHDIEGIERIRFITCHPKDTHEALFRAMRTLPKVSNHIHLPLQSGSARMLRKMKRGYTPGHYLGLVEKLRRHIPDCAVTTDIIVGFPGETEEDFRDTYEMMERIGYNGAYIFKYSPRPPAESSRMEDDVPMEVKKRRNNELLALQKKMVGSR